MQRKVIKSTANSKYSCFHFTPLLVRLIRYSKHLACSPAIYCDVCWSILKILAPGVKELLWELFGQNNRGVDIKIPWNSVFASASPWLVYTHMNNNLQGEILNFYSCCSADPVRVFSFIVTFFSVAKSNCVFFDDFGRFNRWRILL